MYLLRVAAVGRDICDTNPWAFWDRDRDYNNPDTGSKYYPSSSKLHPISALQSENIVIGNLSLF